MPSIHASRFLILLSNIFCVCPITELIHTSILDFIRQILIFVSNCQASAHLDCDQSTIFVGAEYNSMYQFFWYAASRVQVFLGTHDDICLYVPEILGTRPGVQICTRNRSTKYVILSNKSDLPSK